MDGALIIDKPAGITSHDVVAKVRKIIGARRVGHTGTLDPFATGVLVILVGRATRLAQFLSGQEKEYEAVIRFGYSTDTGDVTGSLISSSPRQSTATLQPDRIDCAVASLRGEIQQTPPMYSAKKVGGRKLYEFARRGEHVERQPVRIKVGEFEVMPIDADVLRTREDGTCDLKVRVVCSAGTYVRVLAEDLGRELGVGAHLAELRRTRAGRFKIANAITLERLAEVVESSTIESAMRSPDAALADFPAVALDAEAALRTRNGIDVSLEDTVDWDNGQPVRLHDASRQLIGVGIYQAARKLIHPKVVIADR
jgi:tRNA pseudouridine55 synthase